MDERIVNEHVDAITGAGGAVCTHPDDSDLLRKPTLKATELAVVLGCCRRTIYRRDDAGEIPAPVRIGRQVRWRTDEVKAWLDARCPRRDRSEPMWRMSGQKGVRR